MNSPFRHTAPLFLLLQALLRSAPDTSAAVQANHERVEAEDASAAFELQRIPRPAVNDAAAKAGFRLIQGARDPNAGDLSVLHDGQVPGDADAPAANFFLRAGGGGGRLLVDLHSVLRVAQVNTYSWHAGERGPQVYTLFGASGAEPGFSAEVGETPDPTASGWTRLASVDTRPGGDVHGFGGQYGVQITDTDASRDLGSFRYLLFVIAPTQTGSPFGHTFFSEIDVMDRNGPAPESIGKTSTDGLHRTVALDEGRATLHIDVSAAPDLLEWVETEIVPLARAWYPEIARMLSSPGYEAPRKVTLVFAAEGDGVAATSGSRITCWAKWFRANLAGEAKGAVLHELVHVVQQYGRGRNRAPGAVRPPGWLVEGIPDYIRWFRYEPHTGGARLRPAAADRARHDASYRVSANFLDWVTSEHGPRVYRELNAAMREGRYREELWKELIGHSVVELADAWRADLARRRDR